MTKWTLDQEQVLRACWPDYHKAARLLAKPPVTVHGKAMRMGLQKTRDGSYVKPSGWHRFAKPLAKPIAKPQAQARKLGRLFLKSTSWF
jgi:hypothetical protein